MKSWPLLLASAMLALPASSAGLKDVHAVYLMPMSGGLDQLLAVRLTQGALFEVVTDPGKADAVFTERIGGNFETAFKELYEPKPSKEDKAGVDADFTRPSSKPMARNKGSLFLVDRKSGSVIWSTYQKPPSSGVPNLHNLANQIGAKLEKDLKTK
jgi:hypothetical protein